MIVVLCLNVILVLFSNACTWPVHVQPVFYCADCILGVVKMGEGIKGIKCGLVVLWYVSNLASLFSVVEHGFVAGLNLWGEGSREGRKIFLLNFAT